MRPRTSEAGKLATTIERSTEDERAFGSNETRALRHATVPNGSMERDGNVRKGCVLAIGTVVLWIVVVRNASCRKIHAIPRAIARGHASTVESRSLRREVQPDSIRPLALGRRKEKRNLSFPSSRSDRSVSPFRCFALVRGRASLSTFDVERVIRMVHGRWLTFVSKRQRDGYVRWFPSSPSQSYSFGLLVPSDLSPWGFGQPFGSRHRLHFSTPTSTERRKKTPVEISISFELKLSCFTLCFGVIVNHDTVCLSLPFEVIDTLSCFFEVFFVFR